MNSRRRILSVFEGRKPDRIPVSPFIWVNFVNAFCGTRLSLDAEELDERLFDVYRSLGFDTMLRSCHPPGLHSIGEQDSKNWSVSEREEKTGERQRRVTTTIRTPERELRQVKEYKRVTDYDEISAETEWFIKDREDFLQFVKYQPPLSVRDDGRIRRAKELLGEDGVTAPWLPSVFNTVSRLRRLDDLLADAYDEPEFYDEMMSWFLRRQIPQGRLLARAGADIVTYEGNIANGSLAGPAFFREHVLPYERKGVAAIREAGAYVLYHNCGDTNSMYEVYNELGISALETLTPPPYGDADIRRAMEALDRDMALLGNIDQIDFLMTADPETVRERVRALLEAVKERGRFILATSDYLTENTPVANLAAMRDACVEFGVL